MILTPQQAVEIGEALLDAAADVIKYEQDHSVVTVTDGSVAISMLVNDAEDYGFSPVITVQAQ